MSDFAFSNGNKKEGIKGLIFSLIAVVVFSVLMIYMINYVVEYVSDTMAIDPDDLSAMVDQINSLLGVYIIYGLPLIVLDTLGRFYPPGNYARMTFLILRCIYCVIWLYLIFDGGVYALEATGMANSMIGDNGFMFAGLNLTITAVGLMKILIFIGLLRVIVPIGEYFGAKKDYRSKSGAVEGNDGIFRRHGAS